ncbi:hypothetical protein [Nonomuraea cavernae]|uniref:hypothetical protein n=1 Tax=Nonomuraea cavernae TaxID=2045107 RepID=UPI0033EB1AF5
MGRKLKWKHLNDAEKTELKEICEVVLAYEGRVHKYGEHPPWSIVKSGLTVFNGWGASETLGHALKLIEHFARRHGKSKIKYESFYKHVGVWLQRTNNSR